MGKGQWGIIHSPLKNGYRENEGLDPVKRMGACLYLSMINIVNSNLYHLKKRNRPVPHGPLSSALNTTYS